MEVENIRNRFILCLDFSGPERKYILIMKFNRELKRKVDFTVINLEGFYEK